MIKSNIVYKDDIFTKAETAMNKAIAAIKSKGFEQSGYQKPYRVFKRGGDTVKIEMKGRIVFTSNSTAETVYSGSTMMQGVEFLERLQ